MYFWVDKTQFSFWLLFFGHSFGFIPITCIDLNRTWPQSLSATASFVSSSPRAVHKVPSKSLLLRFVQFVLVNYCQHGSSPCWVLSFSVFPQSLSLKCSYYHLVFLQEPKSYFSQMREENRIHDSIAIIALAFLLRKTNKSSICILVFALFLSPPIIL